MEQISMFIYGKTFWNMGGEENIGEPQRAKKSIDVSVILQLGK